MAGAVFEKIQVKIQAKIQALGALTDRLLRVTHLILSVESMRKEPLKIIRHLDGVSLAIHGWLLAEARELNRNRLFETCDFRST